MASFSTLPHCSDWLQYNVTKKIPKMTPPQISLPMSSIVYLTTEMYEPQFKSVHFVCYFCSVYNIQQVYYVFFQTSLSAIKLK